MDDLWKTRMEQAALFEEGELFQSEAYRHAAQVKGVLFFALSAAVPERAEELLDAYIDAVDDVIEFETCHYFQEGFKLGQQDASA